MGYVLFENMLLCVKMTKLIVVAHSAHTASKCNGATHTRQNYLFLADPKKPILVSTHGNVFDPPAAPEHGRKKISKI